MVQNIVNYADNPTGPELLDDYLAKEQENILSSNSGIQRPSYAIAGTPWLDTSVIPWEYKIYDGSNDVIFGTINPSTHNFIVASIDESNIVHKTGNETITGIKTIQGNSRVLYLQNPNISYNTAPSNNILTDIAFTDKDGQEIGVLESIRYDNNMTGLRLASRGADGQWAAFDVRRTANGVSYCEAPTPTDTTTTSGTQIATTGWVNSRLRNYKTNMASIELFPDDGGTYPYIDFHYNGSSSDYTSRIIENASGELTINASKVFAPTPAVSDNSTRITTTAYINNKFKKVNSLPASPDANTFYFIPE